MIELSEINWKNVLARPIDRRAIIRQAAQAWLKTDAGLGRNSTLEVATALLTGTQFEILPEDAPPMLDIIAKELSRMAPFMPEAWQGEAEKNGYGKLIRRWIWCTPSEKEKCQAAYRKELLNKKLSDAANEDAAETGEETEQY